MPKRRYEMLLPLRYTDGRPINAELFLQTKRALLAQFHALSAYPGTVRGEWDHQGKTY